MEKRHPQVVSFLTRRQCPLEHHRKDRIDLGWHGIDADPHGPHFRADAIARHVHLPHVRIFRSGNDWIIPPSFPTLRVRSDSNDSSVRGFPRLGPFPSGHGKVKNFAHRLRLFVRQRRRIRFLEIEERMHSFFSCFSNVHRFPRTKWCMRN